MKARCFAIVVLIFGISLPALFAVDFGGTIQNGTGETMAVGNTTFSLSQSDVASLWFQTPLGEAGRFFVQGSYTFTYNPPDLYRPYLFDLDTAYLQATATNIPNGPAKFTFNMGRLFISGPTGNVLSTRVDGISLIFGYPNSQAKINLGYTGFLLKPTSGIVMSQVDVAAQSDTNVTLGSPRIVGDIELSIPDLVARQGVTLAVLFQQDMHPTSSFIAPGTEALQPSGGGRLDTQYFGMQLAGPLASGLYYALYGYLNTGSILSYVPDANSSSGKSYQYEPILAYLGGFNVTFFPANFLQSRILLRGVYSSGDADSTGYYGGNTAGNSTTFVPISQSQFALIFNPQLGNSANGELNFSFKPFSGLTGKAISSLQTELKSVAFFRTTFSAGTNVGAPVSAAGLLPNSTAAYLGTEVDATLRLFPLSDVGLAISGGAFLPNVNNTTETLGAFPNGTQPALMAQVSLSLTF